MTEFLFSAAIGYGLGQLSPAALISKVKNKDLRENGTGNLGATNTMLVFGKTYGIMVMFFDVLKAFFAIKIAKMLFPQFLFAGLAAGCFAVIGHIYPAYLNFRGGKGVATFAGMILAYDIGVLVALFAIAMIIMKVTDTGHYGPISAAVSFPLLLWSKTKSVVVFGSVAAVGSLIIYKHKENIANKKVGKELAFKGFFSKCGNLDTDETESAEEKIF